MLYDSLAWFNINNPDVIGLGGVVGGAIGFEGAGEAPPVTPPPILRYRSSGHAAISMSPWSFLSTLLFDKDIFYKSKESRIKSANKATGIIIKEVGNLLAREHPNVLLKILTYTLLQQALKK